MSYTGAGKKFMDVVTYTGNGTGQVISGLDFSPDLVWIKCMDQQFTPGHILQDTVRGTHVRLSTDQTTYEWTDSSCVYSFNSDGFSVGLAQQVNIDTKEYVAWCWDAGEETQDIAAGSISYDPSGWNTDKVWSDTENGSNGGFHPQGPLESAFDANLSSYAFGEDDNAYMNFDLNISNVTLVEVYTNNIAGTTNGTNRSKYGINTTSPTTYAATNEWTTIYSGSAITLSNLRVQGEIYGAPNITAIRVNGELLVDPGKGGVPSIPSTVRANPEAGFSVVSYTGNATAGSTIAHGLDSAPKFMIIKSRGVNSTWVVYHDWFSAIDNGPGQEPGDSFMTLNTNDGIQADPSYFNTTLPSDSVFTVGSNSETNTTNNDLIAYCWSEVPGYSKFGKYTGNGDRVFAHTGFKPRYILIKGLANSGYDWMIWDSEREYDEYLRANLSNTELKTSLIVPTSNGFYVRGSHGNLNSNGGDYIYMAFAEQPTKKAEKKRLQFESPKDFHEILNRDVLTQYPNATASGLVDTKDSTNNTIDVYTDGLSEDYVVNGTNTMTKPVTPPSSQRWTWAAWVKRSELGTNQALIGGGDSLSFHFNTDNKLQLTKDGVDRFITSEIFTDTTVWMHVVLSCNTLDGTGLKLYVNGNDVSVFDTFNELAHNESTVINSNSIGMQIGNDHSDQNFGGYMADIQFVDGQALEPNDFVANGEGGQLSPTKYTGWFGTRGYHLDISDDDTTVSAGADASGNNENWVVSSDIVPAGTGGTSSPEIIGVVVQPQEIRSQTTHAYMDGDLIYDDNLNTFASPPVAGTSKMDIFNSGSNLATPLVANYSYRVLLTGAAQGYGVTITTNGVTTSSGGNGGPGDPRWVTQNLSAIGGAGTPITQIEVNSVNAAGRPGVYAIEIDGVVLTDTPASTTVTTRGSEGLKDIEVGQTVNQNDGNASGTVQAVNLATNEVVLSDATGTWGPEWSGKFVAASPYDAGAANSILGPVWSSSASPTMNPRENMYDGLLTTFGTPSSVTGTFKMDIFNSAVSGVPPIVADTSLRIYAAGGWLGYMVTIHVNGVSVATGGNGGPGDPRWMTCNLSGANLLGVDITQIQASSANASGKPAIYAIELDGELLVDNAVLTPATPDLKVDTPNSYGEDTGLGGEQRGTYATIAPRGTHPIDTGNGSDSTLGEDPTNGNLRIHLTTPDADARSSIRVTGGKWYYEVTCIDTNTSGAIYIGWSEERVGDIWAYFMDGRVYRTGSVLSSTAPITTNGDVIGVAADLDAGTMTFSKNGSVFYTINGTWPSDSPSFPYLLDKDGIATPTLQMNFGATPFRYPAPAGYKSINTNNIEDSLVPSGKTAMDVITYTGSGNGRSVKGLEFSPDLVWIKNMDTSDEHHIYDTLRGAGEMLASNNYAEERTYSNALTSFDADGFTVGDRAAVNGNGNRLVAWCWNAGDNAPISNTTGIIASTVKVNASAGFSIVRWVGTGSNGNVGHGLGVAPKFVIVKNMDSAGGRSWATYHVGEGGTKVTFLDSTAIATTSSVFWSNGDPSSSVIHLGNSTTVNEASMNMVAYCWAEVPGFSKFGLYEGASFTDASGDTLGTYVQTGFKPRWIMIRNSTSGGNWTIVDSKRDAINPVDGSLAANTINPASTGSGVSVDFKSDGFQLLNNNGNLMSPGSDYIYMAFAEYPTQYAPQ